ncbi:MAG: hypothetical protein K940chlam9_00146 [Chlamydiae bacterium]|nr:hypothetical protein [Chlamydiota bacterium]
MSFIGGFTDFFRGVEDSYRETLSSSESSREEDSEKGCSLDLAARGINLGLIPVSIVGCGLGVAVGVPLSIANCLTGRQFRKLDEVSHNLLYWGGNSAIALPFRKVLHFLNPSAKITDRDDSVFIGSTGIDFSRLGFLTGIAYDKIARFREEDRTVQGELFHYTDHGWAQSLAKSDSFFKREIASRLCYGLLLLTCVITRVVDSMIGAIAAVFALLTFGYFEELNSLAYNLFRITGIVYDLFYCLSHMVNPHNPVDPFEPGMDHTIEQVIAKKFN